MTRVMAIIWAVQFNLNGIGGSYAILIGLH